MKVTVVGAGYVGLVVATCLAEVGNHVTCVDKDKRKIDKLARSINPIYESGLVDIMKRNIAAKRLAFTTGLKRAANDSPVIFIAVGTPSADDGSADISEVLHVAAEIATRMSGYRIIVTKSTVPVGTHKKICELMINKTDQPFDYVSNPEFLKEGAAVEDFQHPDRIIIGTNNPAVQKIMERLYSPFMRKGNRILFMDPASAEMTKYTANTMLATRISFMNEISALCEKLGADVELVRQGVGSDSRIGPAFLFSGVGFGGSCFPKDIRALIHTGSVHGLEMTIAKSVLQVNTNQQGKFAKRIKDYFSGRENRTTLAVWGLSFKPKTGDIRESPAIYCIKKFLNCQMKIRAYDPEAASAALAALDGKIETFQNGYDALDNADALVIFTDWQEFRTPDFKVIASKLKKPVIFDGKNLYNTKEIRKTGIEYYSIGRAPVAP
jgi:UDPglucose 6-dehydrogenase